MTSCSDAHWVDASINVFGFFSPPLILSSMMVPFIFETFPMKFDDAGASKNVASFALKSCGIDNDVGTASFKFCFEGLHIFGVC